MAERPEHQTSLIHPALSFATWPQQGPLTFCAQLPFQIPVSQVLTHGLPTQQPVTLETTQIMSLNNLTIVDGFSLLLKHPLHLPHVLISLSLYTLPHRLPFCPCTTLLFAFVFLILPGLNALPPSHPALWIASSLSSFSSLAQRLPPR